MPLSRPSETARLSSSSAQCPAISGKTGSAGRSGSTGMAVLSVSVNVTGSVCAFRRARNSRASSSVKSPVRTQPLSDTSSASTCAIACPSIATVSAEDASSASAIASCPAAVRLSCMVGVPASENPRFPPDTCVPVIQTLPFASVNVRSFRHARNSATPSVSAPAGRVTVTAVRSSENTISAPVMPRKSSRCVKTV